MGKSKVKRKKQQIILPLELPREISDFEIEVSDEDLQLVDENRDYSSFDSLLDIESINNSSLEALYEKRRRKPKENEESVVMPFLSRLWMENFITEQGPKEAENNDNDVGDADKSIIKLTKAERRAKLEAKKQGNKLAKIEEIQQTPQEAVLAEVKEDLTAEEAIERKTHKLAELGMALLAHPVANIKSLKEMLQICKDGDHSMVKLGLLSLLAVFKDIIPGHVTEKKLEMKVSQEVKKMRFYESTLLSTYKAYLQGLLALEKQSIFHHVAVCCIFTLLIAAPYFNFCESLLNAVVRNRGSSDDVIRENLLDDY